MSIPVIKFNGKMVPARKNSKGKWEPIPESELVFDKDGEIKVKKSKEEKK